MGYFASILHDARARRGEWNASTTDIQGGRLNTPEPLMSLTGDADHFFRSTGQGLSRSTDVVSEFNSVANSDGMISGQNIGDSRSEERVDIVMPEASASASVALSSVGQDTDRGMLSILQDEEISRLEVVDDSSFSRQMPTLPENSSAEVSNASELLSDVGEFTGPVESAEAKMTNIESSRGIPVLQNEEGAIQGSVEHAGNARQVLAPAEDEDAGTPGATDAIPDTGETPGYPDIAQAEGRESMRQASTLSPVVEVGHEFRMGNPDSASESFEKNNLTAVGLRAEEVDGLSAEYLRNTPVDAPVPASGNYSDTSQQLHRIDAAHEGGSPPLRSASRRQDKLLAGSIRQGPPDEELARTSIYESVDNDAGQAQVDDNGMTGKGEPMKQSVADDVHGASFSGRSVDVGGRSEHAAVREAGAIQRQHMAAQAMATDQRMTGRTTAPAGGNSIRTEPVVVQRVSNQSFQRSDNQAEVIQKMPSGGNGNTGRMLSEQSGIASPSGNVSGKTVAPEASNWSRQDASVHSVSFPAARVEHSANRRPQPQRPPRVEKPSGPDVHIGQIDVLIQGPPPNKSRQSAEHAPPASATCHYIKGL